MRLAAHLDHLPARRTLELEAVAQPDQVPYLDDWLAGLAGWGSDALGRAICAVCAALLEVSDDRWARDIVAAIDAWTLCPCERHAQAAHRARATNSQRDPGGPGGDRMLRYRVWNAMDRCVEAIGSIDRGRTAETVTEATVGHVVTAIYQAAKARTGGRAVIRAEVVPWALGYRDPVRMRFAKRGQADSSAVDLRSEE